MSELKIEYVNINDLKLYEKNAKKHPSWQIGQIAASIEQFGMDDPIAVWTNKTGDLEIIEGHGRLLACEQLGIQEIPIVRLDHLSDKARRAYTHIHNQLTMNTGFNFEILDAEIEELSQSFSMVDFGFPDIEALDFDDMFIPANRDEEKNDISNSQKDSHIVDSYSDITSSDKNKRQIIVCPECGHEFEL